MFLVHHEVLRVVHVVVVRILNPDPERFTGLAVSAVVPLERAADLEDDA